MTAIGTEALYRAEMISKQADIVAALTLDALIGTPVAFDEDIHANRPHPGQQLVAARLRALLDIKNSSGSQIRGKIGIASKSVHNDYVWNSVTFCVVFNYIIFYLQRNVPGSKMPTLCAASLKSMVL